MKLGLLGAIMGLAGMASSAPQAKAHRAKTHWAQRPSHRIDQTAQDTDLGVVTGAPGATLLRRCKLGKNGLRHTGSR